ncbi:hypothetical protein ACHAXN_000140, partial [Cyclotella atomus]
WVIPTSWGVGLVCGLLWIWPFGPMAKQTLEQRKLAREQQLAATSVKAVDQEKAADNYDEDEVIDPDEEYVPKPATVKPAVVSFHDTTNTETSEETLDTKPKTFSEKLAAATFNQDLEKQSFHESKHAEECWSNMTHYDEGVEQLFTFVQVFTASMNAFAHGANDIANAIAPVAGILAIYQSGELASKSPVPKWILAYGGVGLVLGLALYGYKVMKTIGYKLTALSPTRGASAELAASLTVVTASYIGLPVSTTQCIVGAVSGIGCVEGWRTVQWGSLAKVCVGWVVVFFTAAVLSAG